MPAVTWSHATLRMTPPVACSRISSSAAHEAMALPRTSMSSTYASFSSRERFAHGPVRMSAPALFTQMSTPPMPALRLVGEPARAGGVGEVELVDAATGAEAVEIRRHGAGAIGVAVVGEHHRRRAGPGIRHGDGAPDAAGGARHHHPLALQRPAPHPPHLPASPLIRYLRNE